MIKEAELLKTHLSPQQLRLYSLINDLEIILLQIANLENEYDFETIEILQSSAKRKSILFKIRIDELLSPDQQSEPAHSNGDKNKSEKRKGV